MFALGGECCVVFLRMATQIPVPVIPGRDRDVNAGNWRNGKMFFGPLVYCDPPDHAIIHMSVFRGVSDWSEAIGML